MSQGSNHRIGQEIGNGDSCRYRIEDLLGGGGAGEVFVALDTQLGKRVALKLLRTQLNQDSNMRKHFEREVSLCTAIKSEHVVMVTDFGITKAGQPFYVMELLKGCTLRELLKQKGQLAIEQTKQIAIQICEGLEQAHTGVNLWSNLTNATEMVKVIHCDLKPDNIFLVPTVFGELVKILDFGIAKLNFIEDTSATTPVSGGFWGTFRYAAPEQLEERHILDERADIYSLGIMLYEMLTGTDPFGLSGQETPMMTWAIAHTTKLPIPLKRQPNTEHIPKDLEAIVMRCIEKLPEKRISSVIELKSALVMVTQDAGKVNTKDKNPWRLGLGVIGGVVTVSLGIGIAGMRWWETSAHTRVLKNLHSQFRYEECVSYAKALPYRTLPPHLLTWENQCLLDWGGDLGGNGLFKESFSKLLEVKVGSLKQEALTQINLFSQTILEKGEINFQLGKGELAIVDAKVIPPESTHYDRAQESIKRWRQETDKALIQLDRVKSAYQNQEWLQVIDASYCFPKIKVWQSEIKPLVAVAKQELNSQGVPIPVRGCP